HVLPTDPDDRRVRIIVVAPTSDLVQQIAEVARVASARSGRPFHVTAVVGGGGANAKQQRWRLQQGSEVVVATPGRLKFFMEEDCVVQKDTWQHVKALVIDEVDTLVGEDSPNPMFDLKAELPADLQWVFVTATVSEAAKREIRMLKGQLQGEANDLGVRKDGQIVWTRGPGLHRVPQNCEHVLVDCTPKSLYNLPNSARLDAVMKAKIGALAWHLEKGVLCEESDNRVMIFCNTISNCSRVYEALDERNPDDERSGGKQWKLLVLHGLRDKKEYQRNMDLFSTEKVPAADFFKRRILICTAWGPAGSSGVADGLCRGLLLQFVAPTPWICKAYAETPDPCLHEDRLSRGMDFGSNPVKWARSPGWLALDAFRFRICRNISQLIWSCLMYIAGLEEAHLFS
ncbi:unnamed protein product, partial [Symbiodinium sp. CCMP2456]